jgi:sigma-E factor negative regulatory protein RseB
MIRKTLFLFLLLPASLLAADLNDPWLMIEKAGQAAHQLNYKGLYIYQSGSTVSSLQIMHTNYGPAGEFARVVELDGLPREMLRQGKDVVIYQPKSEKVIIDKRRLQNGFPAVLPRISEEQRSNYQARLLGTERIGGRDAMLVTLEPHDKYRYRSKIWLDRDSGLLLKMALLNDKDEVLEQAAFNQLILVNNAGMDWFHPEVQQGKNYEISPEAKVTPSTVQDDSWVISQLPPGFRKTDQVLRTIPGKAYPVNQLVFCDGFASVSLFIEPVPQGVISRVGSFSQGATNVVVTVNSGHQIVVMGEVPAITLTQISNAVSFRK